MTYERDYTISEELMEEVWEHAKHKNSVRKCDLCMEIHVV